MNVRTAFIASLIALSFDLSYIPSSKAENVVLSVHAFVAKGPKKVKFRVINKTGEPIEVKMGDQIATISVDQPMDLNLPVGTQILITKSTERFKIGDVLIQVSETYRDTNVVLHNK